jgi:hypothetical protein
LERHRQRKKTEDDDLLHELEDLNDEDGADESDALASDQNFEDESDDETTYSMSE